jgi:two-component system, cell cycle response regulator
VPADEWTVQATERTDHPAPEWAAEPPRAGMLATASDLIHDGWARIVGPGGWRSIAGPSAFAIAAIGLLVYDHLNKRVSEILFWLTLGLIIAIFARIIETNRQQSCALEEREQDALNDQVTGLNNRRQLEGDIEAAVAAADTERILVLLELDGLQNYNDRFGYAAGDDLLRNVALQLISAVTPLGGNAYRLAASRLAVLVPAGHSRLGEIILAATTSLRDDDKDLLIGRSYGEVTIPSDTDDVECAIQIAGQRLATHKERQHRSARRQAQSVLMAALSARHPELRDELRISAYRAISLARRLEVSRDQIDDVALAAELHSIGLLAIPEAMIQREAGFEESDPTGIRSFPVEGANIICAAPGLTHVADLVRATCERFDGGGYPDGLAGNAIPVGSRIIAVAVAFASMTSPRPHRAAHSATEAIAEIGRYSGTRFDPRVVDALAAEISEEAASVAA